MTTDDQARSAVLPAGRDDTDHPNVALPGQGAVAQRDSGGAAAGPWPAWARPQLEAAAQLAASTPTQVGLAGRLYREWFHPIVLDGGAPPNRPLAGLYRAAHAGTATRTASGGLSVLRRHDTVRPGGWWRTWGDDWTPRTSRGSVRLLFTPRTDRLAEFVTAVTAAMLPTRTPWSLACALDPRRLARTGCAVLDVPELAAVPVDLLSAVPEFVRPVNPPLCLPLAPGVSAAEYPDNGMTFGEHRCHLLALALRHSGHSDHSRAGDPLRSIAAIFTAHGLDPARPHRS